MELTSQVARDKASESCWSWVVVGNEHTREKVNEVGLGRARVSWARERSH